MSTRWSNLTRWQLKYIARVLAFAERHAMSEYSKADGIPFKNRWSIEVKELAEMQSEVRDMVEKSPYSIEP